MITAAVGEALPVGERQVRVVISVPEESGWRAKPQMRG